MCRIQSLGGKSSRTATADALLTHIILQEEPERIFFPLLVFIHIWKILMRPKTLLRRNEAFFLKQYLEVWITPTLLYNSTRIYFEFF